MGALRDLVAILLLVIGPISLIVVGVVILANQPDAIPEPVDLIEELVERAGEPQSATASPKTSAMDHMLDGSDAFYQAELARDEGDAVKANRLLKAAITHFERAVTIDGNMADAHRSLAVALDEAGREDAALDHWRAYVVLEPEGPDAEMVRELIASREDAATEPPAKELPAAKAVLVKKRLGRKDVAAVVSKNRVHLQACVDAARDRGEMPAVRRLVLEWTVEPNGTVTGGRLFKPKKQRKTELGRCVAGVLSRWRFPASKGRTPIKLPLLID